jgi:hypothetical protein
MGFKMMLAADYSSSYWKGFKACLRPKSLLFWFAIMSRSPDAPLPPKRSKMLKQHFSRKHGSGAGLIIPQ